MSRKEMCTKCLCFIPVESPTYLGKFVCASCKGIAKHEGKK